MPVSLRAWLPFYPTVSALVLVQAGPLWGHQTRGLLHRKSLRPSKLMRPAELYSLLSIVIFFLLFLIKKQNKKQVSHIRILLQAFCFLISNLFSPLRREVTTLFKIPFNRELAIDISMFHNLHRGRESVQGIRIFIDSYNKENSRHEKNR